MVRGVEGRPERFPGTFPLRYGRRGMAKRAAVREMSLKTAVGYLRVSTDQQQLGAQQAECQRWAEQNGITVVEWHADILSGATPIEDREGLMAAIDACKKRNARWLVVAKRDRLARDVVIAAMAERIVSVLGTTIVTADGASSADSPEGQLMRTILDAFAQFERHLIRWRTRAAMAQKREKGEYLGAVPFGYRTAKAEDGRVMIVEDERERAVGARIKELRAEGVGFRHIGRALAAEGMVSRKGRPYGMKLIHKMATTEIAERVVWTPPPESVMEPTDMMVDASEVH